jgi:formylglycine-generating enzyme required for sulfatase activity
MSDQFSSSSNLSPLENERANLLLELEDLTTIHVRRKALGEHLNELGDTRPGVGVQSDGIPDILWLSITPDGTLEIEEYGVCQIQSFYIASYPITYAQYEAFVIAEDGYKNPKWWQGMPKDEQMNKLVEQNNKGWNSPRENVSWYQSVAFSRWLNQHLQGLELPIDPTNSGSRKLIIGQNIEVRLPLEWEWQWAAQGGLAQHTYPWGKWQYNYANTNEANLRQTLAVGMYPQGKAVCGAYDLIGNLWEWCLNKDSKGYDENRAMRGGSFSSTQRLAQCAFRGNYRPSGCDNRLGFRLVIASPVILL